MNCSTWRRTRLGLDCEPKPPLKTVALRKRKSVSTLPSCRKPKPRTCGGWVLDGPGVPLLPALMNGITGMPNMPTFW